MGDLLGTLVIGFFALAWFSTMLFNAWAGHDERTKQAAEAARKLALDGRPQKKRVGLD